MWTSRGWLQGYLYYKTHNLLPKNTTSEKFDTENALMYTNFKQLDWIIYIWQKPKNYYIDLKFKTCNFVADEFATLNFADRSKQGADLLLRHRLRQVVDDQVGLALVIFGHDVLGSLKNETAKYRHRQSAAENKVQW